MQIELVFLAKLILSAGLTGLVGVGLGQLPWLRRQLAGRETAALFWAFVLTRLVPFVVVYIVLDELPRGDVPFFYTKAANALQGGLVYVDFWSFHAPLFAYILTLPLIFWHDPRAIVLLMLLMEGVTVWFTYRHVRRQQRADAVLPMLLYLLLPAPIAMCLLGGQEDVWLWLFGLLAMLAYGAGQSPSRSAVRMGLVLAAGLLVLKVTFILIVFPLFWLVRDKIRFVGTLLLVGIPALVGLYVLTGWKFLMPIQHSDLVFSPNLVSVLRPWVFGLFNNVSLKTLNAVGMVATISTVSLVGYGYRKLSVQQAFPALWIITFGVFELFQASAMAYYTFVFMLPFAVYLVSINNRWQIACLLILNWLVVVQPYFTIVLHQPLFTNLAVIGQPNNGLVYFLDLSTVLLLGWMVWLALKTLQSKSR